MCVVHPLLMQLVENSSSEHRKLLSELENWQSLKAQLTALGCRLHNVESDLEVRKLICLQHCYT